MTSPSHITVYEWSNQPFGTHRALNCFQRNGAYPDRILTYQLIESKTSRSGPAYDAELTEHIVKSVENFGKIDSKVTDINHNHQKLPRTTPTPRTDYAAALYLHDREAYYKLADFARTLERELATWRELPPREHYDLTDCHKARRYHIRLIRSSLKALAQIEKRAEWLHSVARAGADGVAP